MISSAVTHPSAEQTGGEKSRPFIPTNERIINMQGYYGEGQAVNNAYAGIDGPETALSEIEKRLDLLVSRLHEVNLGVESFIMRTLPVSGALQSGTKSQSVSTAPNGSIERISATIDTALRISDETIGHTYALGKIA